MTLIVRRGRCWSFIAAAACIVAAATSPPAAIGSASASGPPSTLRGEIVVSAAASLTGTFTQIGRQFRRSHPGVRVRFNFASTSSLVSQIRAGAPVDVFASADASSQDLLRADGLLSGAPRIFARNTMQIAVKPGNPLRVAGVRDLERLGVIALCARTAPCGMYAESVLALNGAVVPERRITRGADAKSTLGAVAVGDAEAAVVYLTDVVAAGRSVSGVPIPASRNVRAAYEIAVVRGTRNREIAQAFIAHVLGTEGRGALARSGFLAP